MRIAPIVLISLLATSSASAATATVSATNANGRTIQWELALRADRQAHANFVALAASPAAAAPAPCVLLPFDPLGLNAHCSAGPLQTAIGNLPSFPAQVQALVQGGVATVIADAQAADSIAGAPDPNSKTTPPAPINPLAHMCFTGLPTANPPIPGLIVFLQNLPDVISIPQPTTGTAGVLTGIVIAQDKINQGLNVVSSLSAASGPITALHMACDAWVLQLMKLPAAIGAAAVVPIGKLLLMLPKG